MKAELKNILYIDDNPQSCLLTKIYLERNQYHVFVSSNTEKARRILTEHAIHCILTDIGLPGEDGVTFYKWLMTQPQYKDIPVLFVSAHAIGFDEILMRHKANFISKPIFYPDLIKKLQNIFSDHMEKSNPD
jgi:CheY-like chemotaxis protein